MPAKETTTVYTGVRNFSMLPEQLSTGMTSLLEGAPERWYRIVELASQQGEHLPAEPDSKALNEFLMKRKAADPDHFADLSLAVIKLMGPGEYVWNAPVILS
jgi:hypothetical protein